MGVEEGEEMKLPLLVNFVVFLWTRILAYPWHHLSISLSYFEIMLINTYDDH